MQGYRQTLWGRLAAWQAPNTLQIPNPLGNKFSHWDSQNETLVTHDEKKTPRNYAKCFLFWENHVTLRIYLIDLIYLIWICLKMSWICLTNCFLSCKEQWWIWENKLTIFQVTVCKTVVIKIYTFLKIQEGSLFYLSFWIMHEGGIYFTNHKKKDYFPEGARLLNLTMSTLKE